MILLLDGPVDGELTNKIIKFYNELPAESSATIYLQSNGGMLYQEQVIVSLLNKYKSRTTLIGCGNLFSAAFSIFFSAECAKQLLPGTTGMYHFTTIEVRINQKLSCDYTEDIAKRKFMSGWIRENFKDFMKQLPFTKEEREKMLKGKDVYFQPDRMNVFLQHNGKA